MDRLNFGREVAALKLGKRLPDSVYAHIDVLPRLPDTLRLAVAEARTIAGLGDDAFHVVKFALRAWKIPLAYPGSFRPTVPSARCELGCRSRCACRDPSRVLS